MTTIVSKFTELGNSGLPALVTYDSKFEIKESISWSEYVNQSLNFAKMMKRHNKRNVAIHAFNCPEWFITAMGSLCSGRYFCGIYNTNKNDQCMHIIQKGECDLLVVESCKLLFDCYDNVLHQLADNKIQIIVINDDSDELELSEQQMMELASLNIRSWSLLNLDNDSDNDNDGGDDNNIQLNLNSITENDICTLIFTSGTTGNPKAVEVTHKNVMAAVVGVMNRIQTNYEKERIVSYLPLSHIAGQNVDIYLSIMCASPVHFARPDALKGSLGGTLLAVRPTIFLGVPRVWEKFMETLIKVSEKKYNGSTSKKLLGSVMSVVKGIEYYYNTSDNWMTSTVLYIPACITSLVTHKIKEAIGLDQCRYFASGAAPISKNVLEYFASIGIPIFEIYGMSETAGVITVSNPVSALSGSCGKAIDDVEIKINPSDNEILVKGDNIFRGYHNHDGNNGIDADGYLHTGDCGRLDDEGNLYIIGRIKDLIITAGGENIPPTLIEDKIKELTKCDCQVVLIGDKKKFLTVLIFSQHVLDKQKINDAIIDYNKNHAISNAQTVKKFEIIPEALTIENGLLTATMKVKRNKVVDSYSKIIDTMYADSD